MVLSWRITAVLPPVGVSVTVIPLSVFPAGLATTAGLATPGVVGAALVNQPCWPQAVVAIGISRSLWSDGLLALAVVGVIATWGLRVEAWLQLRPPLASGNNAEVKVLLAALLGSTVWAR